jgi:hypothetical protein
MSRAKNEAIGEVECPQKGCTGKSSVFRFQPRGAGKARFAGKLYADCPVHGRYGADGKQGAQEYILENATIWGDKAKTPAATGPAPVTAPAQIDLEEAIAAAKRPTAPPAARHWTEEWAPLIK